MIHRPTSVWLPVVTAVLLILFASSEQNAAVFVDHITGYNQPLVSIPFLSSLYIDSALVSTGVIQSTEHEKFGVNSPLGPIVFETIGNAAIDVNASNGGILSIEAPNEGGIQLRATDWLNVVSQTLQTNASSAAVLQSNQQPLSLVSPLQPLSFNSQKRTSVSAVDQLTISSQYDAIKVQAAVRVDIQAPYVQVQSGAVNSQLLALNCTQGDVQVRAAQLMQVLAASQLSLNAKRIDVSSAADDLQIEVSGLLTVDSRSNVKVTSTSVLFQSLLGDIQSTAPLIAQLNADTVLVSARSLIDLTDMSQLFLSADNDINLLATDLLQSIETNTFSASADIVFKPKLDSGGGGGGSVSNTNSIQVSLMTVTSALFNLHTANSGSVSMVGSNLLLDSQSANVVMSSDRLQVQVDSNSLSTPLSGTTSIEFVCHTQASLVQSTSSISDSWQSPTINLNANHTLQVTFNTIEMAATSAAQTIRLSAQDQLWLSANKWPINAGSSFDAKAADRIQVTSAQAVSLSSQSTLSVNAINTRLFSSNAISLTSNAIGNSITFNNINGQLLIDSSGDISIAASLTCNTDQWHTTSVVATQGAVSIGSASSKATFNGSNQRWSFAAQTFIDTDSQVTMYASRDAVIQSTNGVVSLDSTQSVTLSSGDYISIVSRSAVAGSEIDATINTQVNIGQVQLSSAAISFDAKESLIIRSAGDLSAQSSNSGISVEASTIKLNQSGWIGTSIKASQDMNLSSQSSLSIDCSGPILFTVGSSCTFQSADDFVVRSAFVQRLSNEGFIRLDSNSLVTINAPSLIGLQSTNRHTHNGQLRFESSGQVSIDAQVVFELTSTHTSVLSAVDSIVFNSADTNNQAAPIIAVGSNKLQVIGSTSTTQTKGGGVQLVAESGTIQLISANQISLTSGLQYQIVTSDFSTTAIGADASAKFTYQQTDSTHESCTSDINVQADLVSVQASASLVFESLSSDSGMTCDFQVDQTASIGFESLCKRLFVDYQVWSINAINSARIGGGYTQLLTAGTQTLVAHNGISIRSLADGRQSTHDQQVHSTDAYSTNGQIQVTAGGWIKLIADGPSPNGIASQSALAINALNDRLTVTIDNGAVRQTAQDDIRLATSSRSGQAQAHNLTINASANVALWAIDGAIQTTAAGQLSTMSNSAIRLFAMAQNSSLQVSAQAASVYFSSFGDISIDSQLQSISLNALNSLHLQDDSQVGLRFNAPNGISIGAPLGDVTLIAGSAQLTDADLLVQSSSAVNVVSSNRQQWHSFGPTSGTGNTGLLINAVTSAISATANNGTINLLSDGLTRLEALNGLWTANAQSGDLAINTNAQLSVSAIGNSQFVSNLSNLAVNATGGGGLVSVVTGANQAFSASSSQSFVSLLSAQNSTLAGEGAFRLTAAGGNIQVSNQDSQQAINIRSGGSLSARTSSSSINNENAVLVVGERATLTAGNDINIESAQSIGVGSLGTDSRLGRGRIAPTNPLIAINANGDESVIGVLMQSVGDIQVLSTLASGSQATAAGLQATSNWMSLSANNGLVFNSNAAMSFNSTQSTAQLIFDAGDGGALNAHGQRGLIVSATNIAELKATGTISLNAAGSGLAGLMTISSANDLQLNAQLRTDSDGGSGTNGELLVQSVLIEHQLQDMSLVGGKLIRITATAGNRGRISWLSDASINWQASNTMAISTLRGFGGMSWSTSEENSDLRVRTTDAQRQSNVTLNSQDSIQLSSQTLRTDAEKSLQLISQTASIDVVATNSLLVQAANQVQMSATEQLSFASGSNAYGAASDIRLNAAGRVNANAANNIVFDTPAKVGGQSINVQADSNLSLISQSANSQVQISTNGQARLNSIEGSLNMQAQTDIQVTNEYFDVNSQNGNIRLESNGVGARLAVVSQKQLTLSALNGNSLTSTQDSADVTLLATDDLSWSVAQAMSKSFVIAADDASRADVNITSLVSSVSITALTAINSMSKSYTLVSSANQKLSIVSQRTSGDIVWQATQAQVSFNSAGGISINANPSNYNALRTGTVDWQSRGTQSALTSVLCDGTLSIAANAGNVALQSLNEIQVQSPTIQFDATLVSMSASGFDKSNQVSLALVGNTTLSSQAVNSMVVRSLSGKVNLASVRFATITSERQLGTATGQVRFSSGYGARPLDPVVDWAGIRFTASTFAAVSLRGNATANGKEGVGIECTNSITAFSNGITIGGTLLISSDVPVFLGDHLSVINYGVVSIDALSTDATNAARYAAQGSVTLQASIELIVTAQNITLGRAGGVVDFQAAGTNDVSDPYSFVQMMAIDWSQTPTPIATLEFDFFVSNPLSAVFTEASDNAQACTERELRVDWVSRSLCVCNRYAWECRLADDSQPYLDLPIANPAFAFGPNTFVVTPALPAQYLVIVINIFAGTPNANDVVTLSITYFTPAGGPPPLVVTLAFVDGAQYIINNAFAAVTGVAITATNPNGVSWNVSYLVYTQLPFLESNAP